MHTSADPSTSGTQKMDDLEAKWKEVPDKYFMIIAQFLAGHINDTDAYERFNGPILKASIRSVYWIFLVQYALLAVLGVLMNVAIVAYIVYHKLYKDVTHAFIMNLALCHFVQCAIVLPITLMVMLIQNWIYGQFLCFFLPMLQDIPLHVAMISHILIAWDRMRWLGDPLKARLPAFVCCCTTWLAGMVIALPYPIYTIYVEIGDYVPRLDGIGLCVINLMDDMHEYMRGLFVIMYCAPTVLLAYLYIRTSQELRPPDGPFMVMMFEQRAEIRNQQRNSSACSVDRSVNTSSGIGSSLATAGSGRSNGTSAAAATRAFDLYNAELDVRREKRKQRNLGSMAAAQVVCLCPLMVLRLARMVVEETYDNTKHFDFTFLMFVWIAFLPTVIFPCIYASQILPRTEQKRLRGYLRLSVRHFKKSRSTDDSGHSPDSREDSIAKDDNKSSGLHSPSLVPSRDFAALANGRRAQQHGDASDLQRHSKEAPAVSRGGKDDDLRVNVISSNRSRVGAAAERQKASQVGGSGGRVFGSLRQPPGSSADNNSCSNVTSSTYCNGASSLLDGDASGSCDGEDSSIVSGMIVHGSSAAAFCDRRALAVAPPLRHKDLSFSDSGSFVRMDSCSTLERDLEIIDLLERERSMDLQEMLESERRAEAARVSGDRRRLPDIERIYKSPSAKPPAYACEKSLLTRTASTASAKEALPASRANSSESNNETYCDASTLRDDEAPTLTRSSPLLEDEEPPPEVFAKLSPGAGDVSSLKRPAAAPGIQYQYSRRLSRKASHHSQGSHRASKRDSFNSLHGSDLIAGTFGELDPTQALSKMSAIESRMRRSSGRAASFSSSGRSSMKSRDFSQSSTHSAHPELDFRENIFAEL